MIIFLDTSSLFKLYVSETGSEELYQLFDHLSIEQICLSEIAVIEFHSTIWRKVRMKEITVDEAHILLNAFDHDCVRYRFAPLGSSLLQLAQQLLDTYGQRGLRSLDAIQLASAVSLRQEVQLFKTADTLLHSFFIAESLPVAIP